MIRFSDIYNKAINLFDDPTILKAYVEDPVRFQRLMYPFLQNAVDEFQNPSIVREALFDQTAPSGQMETFVGADSATFVLTIVPPAGADIACRVNGKIDPGAIYDAATNSVTFSAPVPQGIICVVEWYLGGQFNSDFAGCASANASAEFIRNNVIGILARMIVLAWAQPQRDNLLGVSNFLRDSDFKLFSNGTSLRAQKEWVDGIRRDISTMENKLSWNLVSRKYHGGKFYG